MESAYVSAHDLFDDMMRETVTPILKPLGFRKTALNYYRRHQDVIQVINFQSSASSHSEEKRFYVNVAMAFDAIYRLTDKEIVEKPRYSFCDDVGMRQRLEQLIDGAVLRWSVRVDQSPDIVARPLQEVIEKLALEMQSIDSLTTYRNHRWFQQPYARPPHAQILYLLGDFDAAWKEVQALATAYDKNATIYANPEPRHAEYWVQNLRLPKLAERLKHASPD